MNYPDVKAIVSGYFKPLDPSRCLVCGAELHTSDTTCSKQCFAKMCQIQRLYTEQDCQKMVDKAKQSNDSRLV